MKRKGYVESLEEYFVDKFRGIPLPYERMLFFFVIVLLVVSLSVSRETRLQISAGARPTDRSQVEKLIEGAAKSGDYEMARGLYESGRVFGARSDAESLEYLVYPERYVGYLKNKYLKLAAQYPGSRDIYLQLALLYFENGEVESAVSWLKKAEFADPNGEEVGRVRKMMGR